MLRFSIGRSANPGRPHLGKPRRADTVPPMLWRSTIATSLIACATLAGAEGAQQKALRPGGAPAPVHGFSVVRSYPHDPQAFTQGLEFVDGVLYESTGLNGRSGIRKVNLATGEVLQIQPL